MSHINKNNASHISELLFQEHTHTVCIFKVHWTMKLSSTKTLNLHMNIVKCSIKLVEKIYTFWNKIKVLCCFAYRFSHVFPAVGIQSKKVQKEFGRGLILCLHHGFAFSHWLETDMTSSNAAALHTQNDCCMTSKLRESYKEQTAPTDLSVHSKRDISPSEGHFSAKTIIAAILKGRSKLKCSKLATLKGPSEWRISRGTTDGHFGLPWSFGQNFCMLMAPLCGRDDNAEGHIKKQLFGPLHPSTLRSSHSEG